MQFSTPTIQCLRWSGYLPKETQGLPYLKDMEKSLNTQLIPAMVRRRCSESSKIALTLALQTLKTDTVDYAVFASQHGEIHTTVDLLQEMCEDSPLSPSGFSQSVHNTPAGLLTQLLKVRSPTTSLAAGENTFFAGLLEAMVWLRVNPGKKVLLVVYDVKPPKPYDALNLTFSQEYGLALLLSDENTASDVAFQVSSVSRDISEKQSHPPALCFLNWIQQKASLSFEQSFQQQKICWSRYV